MSFIFFNLKLKFIFINKKVDIKSKEEKGTTFYIKLPVGNEKLAV